MKLILGPIQTKLLADATKSMYPTRIWGLKNSSEIFNTIGSTYYGFVVDQSLTFKSSDTNFNTKLPEGFYFCSNGKIKIGTKGTAIIIERMGYQGQNTFGGPVENSGRLQYIDNCKSSLLVYPPRIGDPCLNLLTFPPNIIQTEHVHPTLRAGVILEGNGWCVADNKKIKLKSGTFFYLPEGQKHYFISGKLGMSVLAFHPDSDWGPTDQKHPMLNRTYIS